MALALIVGAAVATIASAVQEDPQGYHFRCSGVLEARTDEGVVARTFPLVVECWVDADRKLLRANLIQNGALREVMVVTGKDAFKFRLTGNDWSVADAKGQQVIDGNWVFLSPFLMFLDRPTVSQVAPARYFESQPQREEGLSVVRSALAGAVTHIEHQSEDGSYSADISVVRRDGVRTLEEMEVRLQHGPRRLSAKLLCNGIVGGLTLPDSLFARPVSREQRTAQLWNALDRNLSLPEICSVEKVADTLSNLGGFKFVADASVSQKNVSLPSGKTADVLFRSFRAQGLDFRLAPEGAIIFSVADSHKYFGVLEVRSPVNPDDLKTKIYAETGHPEDWDYEGGEGSVSIRQDGVVEVRQRPSTLLEIGYKFGGP